MLQPRDVLRHEAPNSVVSGHTIGVLTASVEAGFDQRAPMRLSLTGTGEEFCHMLV